MSREEFLGLQAECMMLFQSNPYMTESVEGIGTRLGRKKEELYPILDLLVKQGIVQLMGKEPTPLYRYSEPVIITEFDSDEADGI
ncbi:hypothetical protein QGM71_05590 [Virgibacillus sp. C22-A2]|uniref:Transcription regulator TrmB N-terminal domain-containing protein n=1 Tax=Virgibacillus tibetensis TaxID=3042313 RepID=A0ABU6KDL1_9BACI|nr:hypothetical protein [Virgibacillus sp. C22-A2]